MRKQYIQITMNKKITLSIVLCIALVLLSIAVGSVSISIKEMVSILSHHWFGTTLDASISSNIETIFFRIRLPRVLVAFCVGGMLSVSGAILQALLQNPLASSYTLGVSSGASLGACIVILLGWDLFSVPVLAFLFGFGTVLFVMRLSQRIDRTLSNQTIILFGMVFSLFVNSMITLISSLNSQRIRQYYVWTMGSFASKGWNHFLMIMPIAVVFTLLLIHYANELDMLTFGDTQAKSMGVHVKKIKWISILSASILTAFAVCFVGTIGFIDLVVPHAIRKIFGPKHNLVIPMSFLMGGSFLAFFDMVARTVLAPIEIPIGAITALIGAPFFLFLYLSKRSSL